MTSFFRMTAALALALLIAAAAGAQVRGRGRIQGVVTDSESGKPLAGAKVTVVISDESTAPIVAMTDKRGRWSVLGLVAGTWNIDIEMAGYATSRGSANVSEMQMLPPVKTQLTPEVKAEVPAPTITDSIPPEVVAAVRAGEDFLNAKQYAEAAAEFEKALPALPDNVQLKQALASAYYGARTMAKAAAVLEPLVAADASNRAAALLLVNVYLEDGRLPEGKALLEKLPEGMVTEPTTYLNAGILFMNKNSVEDALSYFAKAVALDPRKAESYYYRGLASLQLKKTAEAKADLEKVIALAPDSPEAKDAKQLIAAIR